MTLFDLIFIAVSLATAVSLLAVLVQCLRRRWRAARRMAFTLGGLVATYLAVVAAVGALSPQRTIALGQDLCFDDWCIAAEHVGRMSSAEGDQALVVTLRVSSRALRVTQREPDVDVALLDDHGVLHSRLNLVDASQPAGTPASSRPLTDAVGPGESFRSDAAFLVPRDTKVSGLVVRHSFGPGRFVIGDGSSLLHQPTLLRLQ